MTDLNHLIKDNEAFFAEKFKTKSQLTAYAPGRINVIGEHTDYNEGLSMPSAINRWVVVTAKLRTDKKVDIYSRNFENSLQYEIGSEFSPSQSWHKYVYGAIEIFSRDFPLKTGFEACIYGNIPLGSGISSSAGIEVSVMNALRSLYKAKLDDISLVKKCQKIEHEFLKVNSGLLDQYASQFSRQGKLLILDFQAMSHEYVDADMNGWKWVLVDSKVKRELAGSKYTERVHETKSAFESIKSQDTAVKHFRDIQLNHVDLLKDEVQKKRIKHFILENERVYKTKAALQSREYDQVGKLLVESHESLSKDYEVSCKELDYLVEKAIQFDGCAGGRMMGGGFGGCTLNLVKEDSVEEFSTYIEKAYLDKFNIQTEVTDYSLVGGADVKS